MNLKIILSGILFLILIFMGSMLFMGKNGDELYNKEYSDNFSSESGNAPRIVQVENKDGSGVHKSREDSKKIKTYDLKYSISDYLEQIRKDEINLKSLFYKIERRFKDSLDTGSHLDNVYSYLLKKHGREKADIIFQVYSEYIKCRENLSMKLQSFSYAGTKEEILGRIDFVTEFRKEFLGEELFNAIYGGEAENKKFVIERNSIINDGTLYAHEKAERLKELDVKYGDFSSQGEKTGYEKYRESLLIYKKDFADLSTEDLSAKKMELREKFFTPEALEKRKAFDQEDRNYDKKVAAFTSRVEDLSSDGDLSDEEKIERIKEAESNIFTKDEKERYKRNLALKEGRNKLLKKYGFEPEK